MPLQTRKVEAALRSKGFAEVGTDHRVFQYVPLDSTFDVVVRTKTSRGTSGSKKDIDDSMLSIMARQCELTRREFEDLVRCPMSQAQFEAILREQFERGRE